MRVLVLGAAGIVGGAMVREAQRQGWPVRGADRAQVDITDRGSIERAVEEFRPDLVVNCAAFTRVDACETERETAFRINGEAVGDVGAVSAAAEARLVHLSTDYVFDGAGTRPYREDHPTAPRSVYGASKLEGERLALRVPGALVVRTSWIFGAGGANFVDTLRGKMEAGEGPLRVVADQLGAPTYAPFLARALADLGESGVDGLVHYQNREPVTWYEFAHEIARVLGRKVEIRAATTAEVPRPAPRPAYSVLDVTRFEELVGRSVESWRDGLERHLGRIEESSWNGS